MTKKEELEKEIGILRCQIKILKESANRYFHISCNDRERVAELKEENEKLKEIIIKMMEEKYNG